MEMTNAEIVMEYKQAKSPMKQIGILADQNLCTKADIVAVLREAGCDLPKYYQPKDAPVVPQPPKEPAPELVPTELVKQLKVNAYDAIVSMIPEDLGDAPNLLVHRQDLRHQAAHQGGGEVMAVLKWEKISKTVSQEGTTIIYGATGTPFEIQSRKRHIPHAGGRAGTWDHTTYVVTCRGFDVKEFQSLADAKEWAEGSK